MKELKLKKSGPLWWEDTKRYGFRGLWIWLTFWLFGNCPCCGDKPCWLDTSEWWNEENKE